MSCDMSWTPAEARARFTCDEMPIISQDRMESQERAFQAELERTANNTRFIAAFLLQIQASLRRELAVRYPNNY